MSFLSPRVCDHHLQRVKLNKGLQPLKECGEKYPAMLEICFVGFSNEDKEPLLPGCEQAAYIGDGTALFPRLFLESVNPDGSVMGQIYCRHVD